MQEVCWPKWCLTEVMQKLSNAIHRQKFCAYRLCPWCCILVSARVPETVEGSDSAAQWAVVPDVWLYHAAGELGHAWP